MSNSIPTVRVSARQLGSLLLAASILVGCPTEELEDSGVSDSGLSDAGPGDSGPNDSGLDAATPLDAGSDAGTEMDAGPSCTEGSPDDRPPTFGGLTSAISDGATAVILGWDPASDDDTNETSIAYRVFVATTGPFDFTTHRATVRGRTTIRVSGLEEGIAARFVVRAEDRSAQRDCNTVELEVTPIAISGCIDYATVIQPIFDDNCLSCHGGAASNLRRSLSLESFAGALAGGETGDVITACRPESSLLYLKLSETLPVQGHRMPYLAPALTDADTARVRLWIEQGASASCPIVPATCADTTPPSFAGVSSASVVGSDIEVCWSAGSDDVSATSALRYATYLGHGPGTEDQRWTQFVSAAGETCTTIRGVAPDQQYCFITRARDVAGNEDANAVERCVTMPSVACVDATATIQPLLERECVHCHGGPDPIMRLSFETFADTMGGGSSGPVVTACNADDSLISLKISDPPLWGLRMPADGPPHLGDMESLAIRSWISQGARAACTDPDPCASP